MRSTNSPISCIVSNPSSENLTVFSSSPGIIDSNYFNTKVHEKSASFAKRGRGRPKKMYMGFDSTSTKPDIVQSNLLVIRSSPHKKRGRKRLGPYLLSNCNSQSNNISVDLDDYSENSDISIPVGGESKRTCLMSLDQVGSTVANDNETIFNTSCDDTDDGLAKVHSFLVDQNQLEWDTKADEILNQTLFKSRETAEKLTRKYMNMNDTELNYIGPNIMYLDVSYYCYYNERGYGNVYF